MARLLVLNKKEAIKVMEDNLKYMKESVDCDTFVVLSYDLEKNMPLGRSRADINTGRSLVNASKTIVLNEDTGQDCLSVLYMYTAQQNDLHRILPKGNKHDLMLFPIIE